MACMHLSPLSSFDKLMTLLREIAADKLLDFTANHPSRISLMRQMEKIFGSGVEPERVDVPLETDSALDGTYIRRPRDTANVMVFNTEGQIKCLLDDMGIMSDISNLAVDIKNPFGRYISPDDRLGELNSGAWYDRTFAQVQEQYSGWNGPPIFLLTVKLYADKTGTDMAQRHGLEPIMITLNIFKQEIQNQCYRAHRLLGYIPDLDQKSLAQKRQGKKPGSAGRAYRNYHACLKVILNSLEKVCRDGFDYHLTLGKQARLVQIVVRVAIIMGNGKRGILCVAALPIISNPAPVEVVIRPLTNCPLHGQRPAFG